MYIQNNYRRFQMEKQVGKKIGAIGITLTGIMAIVFAIMCWLYWESYVNVGSYISFETYGGDAYTGIQNAAAATANNVRSLIRVVGYATSNLIHYMGYLLFTIGVLLLVSGVSKTITVFSKKSVVNVNTQDTTDNI